MKFICCLVFTMLCFTCFSQELLRMRATETSTVYFDKSKPSTNFLKTNYLVLMIDNEFKIYTEPPLLLTSKGISKEVKGKDSQSDIYECVDKNGTGYRLSLTVYKTLKLGYRAFVMVRYPDKMVAYKLNAYK